MVRNPAVRKRVFTSTTHPGTAVVGQRLRLAFRWLVVMVLMIGMPMPLMGQDEDLTELSLEDLMNIEVSTIGRKRQKLSQIPAAVYVITQEDIRRSGATNLPDVLRLVPGVQVAQIDNSNWAISIRGFNFRSSNKLLVLLDGRAVYYPTYSNVFWDVQSTLIEDIERIEVVRGPGATLWGANAVNGVINIVTKNSKNTQGGLASVTSGSYDHAGVAARYGTGAANHAYYRLFGTYSLRENLVNVPDGQSPSGLPHMLRGGFRADWSSYGRDAVTVQGDIYQGGAPQAVYRSPFLLDPISINNDVSAAGGDVLLRWTRKLSGGSETVLQAYYDRARHPDILLEQIHDVMDIDFQHQIRSRRHDLLWGAGFRSTHQSSHGTWELSLNPSRRNLHLFSGFLQDDIKLVANRLMLTAGTRIEHNDLSGIEVQPTLRLLWTPSQHRTAWIAASRAVRTPSIWENAVDMNITDVPLPDGTPMMTSISKAGHLQSEELLAYEAGYRTQAVKNVSVDLTSFYQHYSHLSSLSLGEPYFSLDPVPHVIVPMRVSNQLNGNTYGAELSGTFSPYTRWKLAGSYSWLRQVTHIRSQSVLSFPGQDGENPNHQFQVRSYLSLPHNLEADTSIYYVGAMALQRDSRCTRWDLRLGWHPTTAIELSINAQDLLATRHYEFNPPGEYLVSAKVKSAWYGRVTWRF